MFSLFTHVYKKHNVPAPLWSLFQAHGVEHLVHSHYVPPSTGGTWLDHEIKGTFRCGSCKACNYIRNKNSFKNPQTGVEYMSRAFANCKTKAVVYMAMCNCPLLYIGKTIREFRRRVLEHVGDIDHSRDTPVALHMRTTHPRDLFVIPFWILEVIKKDERRGNVDHLLLQKEAAWIYRLKTMAPSGLNDQLSFCSFI